MHHVRHGALLHLLIRVNFPPSIGIAEGDGFNFCTQINKLDWVVFNVALFATMFAGVDIGLGVSIGLSIVLALWKSAFPKTSVLGQLPETTVYR